jgi:hypothetical protein
MLHPSGFGKELGKFLLIHTFDLSCLIKNDCPGAGRSLVEGKDKFFMCHEKW